MYIEHINLEVTDACNLRCTMCDIWKKKKNNFFTYEMVHHVFSGASVSPNADITITGGEAFLHPQLVPLVRLINEYRPKGISTLSTNGVLTGEIARFLALFHGQLSEDFSVHISFDGVHAHDCQRGKKSASSILRTIKLLKTAHPQIPIKIKFTITPVNYADILDTFAFCEQNRLIFKPKIAEYAPNYTNRVTKRSFIFSEE